MEANTKTTEVPLMNGSTTGKTYMAFAKNGGFALGVKPVAVMSGRRFGMPDHTWFVAKLRSASAADLFPEPEGNVVTFKKAPDTHEEAWPGITWEKQASSRASTTISLMLPGSVESAEGITELLANVEDGKLATKMTEYLATIAGENLKLDQAAINEWFDGYSKSFAEGLKKKLAMTEALKNEMSQNVGKVGSHADILKKVYEANNANKKEASLDEPESDEEGEEKIVLSDGDEIEEADHDANAADTDDNSSDSL